MRTWLAASIVALVISLLPGCSSEPDRPQIAVDQAMNVHVGMTAEEVRALLGPPSMSSDEANKIVAGISTAKIAPMAAPGRSSMTYNLRDGGLLSVGFGTGGADYIDLVDGAGKRLKHYGPTM